MPLFGRPNVKKLLEKRDVLGLIRVLGESVADYNPGTEIRLRNRPGAEMPEADRAAGEAARALRDIGAASVLPLVETLRNPTNQDDREMIRRAWAATILGWIGDPIATDQLVEALDDPAPIVQLNAAISLGRLGDSRALGPLLNVLDREPDELKRMDRWTETNIRAVVNGALMKILQRRAGSPGPKVLDPRIVRLLVTHRTELQDPEYNYYHDVPCVNEEAVGALAAMGLSATEPLIKALNDLTPLTWSVTQRGAAEALGRIGGVGAEEALTLWVTRRWREVNEYYQVESFEREVRSLVHKLERSAPSIGQAILEVTEKEMLEAHLRARRRSERRSWGSLDHLAIEHLLEHLKGSDWEGRADAASSMGRSGNTLAVEPLIQALEDEHAEVRCAAARSLGMLADARAIGSLSEALGDPGSEVQTAATESLEKIKRKQAERPP